MAQNSSPDKIPTEGATLHDDCSYEQPQLRNLQQFVDKFKDIIPDILAQNPNYDRVKALLFYWEDGDPNMGKDVEKLRGLFHEGYGFEAESWQISVENPVIDLSHFLLSQICSLHHLDEHVLLIIYYGGHGYWDKRKNKHYWKPVIDTDHRLTDVSMDTTILRSILEETCCDLLLLFDCCYSLGMMGDEFVGNRRNWLLAAAGNVEKAGGTTGQTWTAAITQELEHTKHSGGISASRLNDTLTRYDKMQESYQLSATPQIRRYSAPSYPGDIDIKVRKEQEGGICLQALVKQPEKLHTDARMLFNIAFKNPTDELRQEVRKFWSQSGPPNFNEVELAVWKQIQVVDVFQTDSSLLLVTLPVSLWAFFPRHSAYECIDMVRSQETMYSNWLGQLQDGDGPRDVLPS